MSDSYKTELVLVNRATGVAETRAQIDTITKSVAQLAREDALYAQKQAQYSRQREANLRREARASQEQQDAQVTAYRNQQRLLNDWLAAKDTHEKQQTEVVRIQSEARLSTYRKEVAAATALAAKEKSAARPVAAVQQDAHVATYLANLRKVEQAQQRISVQQDAHVTKYLANMRKEEQAQQRITKQQDAHVTAYLNNLKRVEQERARAQAAADKDAARRSVFGVDTGVDIKNFAAGLYTVQAAYRAVAQAAGIAMDAVNEAAKWQKYEVAITTMEGSATVAKQSLQDLYEIAKAPGIDLEGANKSYLQLRAIGIEGERAKTIISEFANTVARSGGGGVEFERVNRQLVQMLANGRVLESELKWMKESMPELAKVMQATFGTTSAEGIRNLGISADEFVRRLTTAFAELPRAEATLGTSLENMATAWSKFQASIVPMGATSFIAEGVTGELEALTAIIEGIKAPIETTRNLIAELKALNDKTDGLTNATLRKVNAQGLSDETRRFLLYGEGMSSAQGAAASRAAFEAKKLPPGPTEAQIKALKELEAEYARTSESAAIAAENKWYEEQAKLFDKNAQALAKLNAVHATHLRQIKERFAIKEKQPASAVNVDYWTATGQSPAEMQYYWNTMRGGTGKENTELAQEKKAAQEEAAAIMRTEQEQEYEEARLWREKALAAVRDDNESRLRVEEAYGKKLADINDKYNKQIAEEEKKRQKERLDAMESFTSGMGSLAGAMGGLIIQMNEQNTEAYAAMVAIQQGFAIAQATMNMWVAMSNALTQPYPLNIAAMGQVAAAGGQIISAITAMNVAKVGKGFFDRGGSLGYGEWGIVGERGPEIVEGPARITSRRATAAMMNSSAGTTGTVVNVHNYAGASVATKTNTDGSIDLIIDKLEERMAEGVYAGSSKLGTAMTRSFGLRRVGT